MSLLNDLAADVASDDVFFSKASGFAEDVAISGGGSFRALFKGQYNEVELGGYAASSRDTYLVCREADAPALDTSITVRSVNYRVMTIEPDGNGMAQLKINREGES